MNGQIKMDLGPVYGQQWREWLSPYADKIDQLSNVVEQIKSNQIKTFDCKRLEPVRHSKNGVATALFIPVLYLPMADYLVNYIGVLIYF